MALTVFTEVGLRYLFNRPTVYVLDIVAALVLASAFLGAAYALLVEGHVRIDLFTNHFPQRMQMTLNVVNYVLVFLYSGVFAWQGFAVTWKSIKYNWRSESIVFNYPLWPLFLLIGIGMLLFSIQAILKIGGSLSAIMARRREKTGASHESI
jgi:TRAP-type C4-dicarboxylate transport system permease small subunit